MIENFKNSKSRMLIERACLIAFRTIKPNRQASDFMSSECPVLFTFLFFVSPMVSPARQCLIQMRVRARAHTPPPATPSATVPHSQSCTACVDLTDICVE